MNKIIRVVVIAFIALVATFIYIDSSESAWADGSCTNCTGGNQTDSNWTNGGSGGGGSACPNNSCGSVVYSGATGFETITVTEETRDVGIHVSSVCTNSSCSSFNYTPSEDTIKTGDAAIGSTYVLSAMYADADGYVYVDGEKKWFNQGDVITYIPVENDGSNGLSSLWSVANSKRDYGDMSYDEAMTYYHDILANLNYELPLTELVAFGGMLKEKYGLTDADLCKIGLCINPDDPNNPNTPKTPPPPVPSCHEGSHAGWTDGKIEVKNMTTDNSWTSDVWARPGDTIRYYVFYCWGVGAVGGSANNDPAQPWAIYPGANATAYGASVDEVWFQLSAQRDDNYLFGYDEHIIGPSRHVLTDPHQENIGGAAPELAEIDPDDASSADYDFLIYSPSDRGEDADSYNCSIYDFASYTISGGHGYQIPGVDVGGCSAISQNGGNMSDAGYELSQTINYSYDTAWQRYRHNEEGECDSTCTWQEEDPPPGVDGHREHDDKEVNTLVEYNSNVQSDPYQSLDAALGAGVNDWGLVKKHGGDTDVHNPSLPGDCDYSPCSAINWRSYPYYAPNCGCDAHAPTYPCGDNGTETCGGECVLYTPGPCWGAFNAGLSTHAHDYPGKSHYKPEKDYTTGMQQLGSKSSTATVHVPYSYRTKVTSAIQEGDVIYTGETVFSAFTASVLPRVVTEVRPGESYATVLPGYIQAIEFIADVNSSLSPSEGSSDAGGTDPCSFYSGLMISDCKVIWEEHGAGPNDMLNEEGRYGGKTYSHSEERVVPDVYPIGSKYCVAVGISSSDSHSQPEAQVVSGMSSPSGWRISGLSCRTIAKKPNFQVWNGGFYTKGSIKTSTTVKRVSANLGDPTDPTGYFGSWEEYYISAKGNVDGMSSGAGLGYYGGYTLNSLGLQGGSSPGTPFCNLSRMTISNENCGSLSQEYYNKYFAGNSMIEDSVATVIERIRSRYLTPTRGIITLENGATHIYPQEANIKTSDLQNISHNSLPNTELSGSVIRQYKSSINSESEQTTRNYASNALVIHVDGTLTIDTDICTGTGTCGSDTNLLLGSRNSDMYDNIYSIPQVLIIADGGVVITNNVTQIDAWIITNGNINTCNGWNYNTSSFSADACGNQLIINGPIFAGSLTPVRNSGADGGPGNGNNASDNGGNPIFYNLTDDGSIQPGEIFNLRPDSLFWAYSQAQRFSQANVTYTRELAPRY